MIDGLPGLQRDVVQLRDMEGLSYRDIAKTLQVTEEQVKVHFALIDTHTSAMWKMKRMPQNVLPVQLIFIWCRTSRVRSLI